jgi:hypothetical protein
MIRVALLLLLMALPAAADEAAWRGGLQLAGRITPDDNGGG